MTPALTVRPFQFKTVSRDALSHRNILCRRRMAVPFDWLDEEWAFELAPAQRLAGPQLRLECDWGGAQAFLALSSASAETVTANVLNGANLVDLPDDVILAVLECAFSGLAQVLERVTRKHLRIVAIARHWPQTPQYDVVGWNAHSAQRQLTGELLLDEVALRFLATEVRSIPCTSQDEDSWNELPLPVKFLVGWVDLPAPAAAGLGLRDVVLLDECFLAQGDRLAIQISQTVGFQGTLDGSNIRVLEGVHEVMSDLNENAPEASQGLLDEIPVRLTFDLGERSIPLGDLKTLQPGYLFNLGRDPKNTVAIRANGRLIGDGELVDIEGRIGVSILRLSPEAN